MPTDERPPPVHTRILRSLRDVFVPASLRSVVREGWEDWLRIYREEQAREEIENPSYRARREIRRYAQKARRGETTGTVMDDLRHVWNLGKPRPKFPAPPANE